jgi:DNA-binding MarR family transcriptional regulator
MITKSDLQQVIDNLLEQGLIEIVGHEDGKPVYDLSESGRRAAAVRTGTPIEELRAMPALREKAAELYPSLRKKMDAKKES